MYYITVRQNPMYRQMSLDEFLFGSSHVPVIINKNESNTRTYKVNEISELFKNRINVKGLIIKLYNINKSFESVRKLDRKSQYNIWYVPKKSGGLRKISSPNSEIKSACYAVKSFLEEDCTQHLGSSVGAMYHTSAHAYIKNRSILSCMKRHQSNESKWFEKLDLSNFFNNTTLDYVMNMMSMIFPFCMIVDSSACVYDNESRSVINIDGKEELRKALELSFLDGGLPQGNPLSPLITNIIMIPVDYELNKKLLDYNGNKYVYTRYADDFTISSKYSFNPKDISNCLKSVLNEFNAPFTINNEKTRYGSANGSNWNLGIMLNKDNELTIGYDKKKTFQNMLFAYAKDRQKGVCWELCDVQTLEGYRNYYRMIEGEKIDRIVNHVSMKSGIDIMQLLKEDLRIGIRG